jgi:hypothetical protein
MKLLNTLILSTLLAFGLAISSSAQSDEPWFSQAELDQMLAPVALYPDTVLSHVLIAATYPLEVIQAARWSRANPGLSGADAVAAVEHMDWDPSVMALVAFPELLSRMDEDIEWTQRLGDAFLVQEDQVVDSIQQLRARAYAQGNLKTNEHVRVVRETQYIYIEPARPRVVYVPYYDPFVVYGSWWWSSYPPVYWRHPPRYVSGIHFYWGPAYRIAPTFYFSSFHWSRRQVVVVNHHHYYNTGRGFRSGREVARFSDSRHWQHNPHHRRGVSYHRGVSEQRFTQPASSQRGRDVTPVRSAQPREQQRDWAARQRENIDLNTRTRAAGTADSQRQRAAQTAQRPAVRPGSDARVDRSGSRDAVSSSRPSVPTRDSRQVRENLATRNVPERAVQRTQPERPDATQRPAVRAPERAQSGRASAPGRSESNQPQRQPVVPQQRSQPERSQPAAPTRQSAPPARSAPERNRPSAAPVTPQRTQPATPRERAQSAPARQSAAPPVQSRQSSAPQPARPARATAPVQPARATPPQRSQPQASPPQRSQPQAAPRSQPQQAASPPERATQRARTRERERN